MSANGRKNADDVLLLALACGATVDAAAQKANVSVRTVKRRLADPAFRQRLAEVKGDMVRRTAAALSAGAVQAVSTLLSLQAAKEPVAVRLGAARAILELGMKVREAVEFEERLAALEQRVGDKPGPRGCVG
jgi:hypothetical protein